MTRTRPLILAAAALAAVAAALAGHYGFGVKTERSFVLAPVLVVSFGAVVGLVILWARVVLDSLRQAEHPRRVIAITIGLFALVALLTALGVELPRE